MTKYYHIFTKQEDTEKYSFCAWFNSEDEVQDFIDDHLDSKLMIYHYKIKQLK